MKLKINTRVIDNMPGIQVGVIVVNNLNNQRKSTAVEQLLRGACAQKKNELKNENKTKELNALMQKARLENLVLPEAQLLESNMRKVGKGTEIKHLNNLYSLINYLGIKFAVPIFAYDLDQTEKDLTIDFIEAKKGKRPEDMDLSGDTVHSVIWFINLGSLGKEDFMALPNEFVNLIHKYCGGNNADTYILDANLTEADLGYESDKEKKFKEENKADVTLDKKETNESSLNKSENTGDIDKPPFLREENNSGSGRKTDSCRDHIGSAVTEAVKKWISRQDEPAGTIEDIDLETPGEPKFGDFSTAVALKLGKKMNRSPHEIADSIVGIIKKPECIEKIEIAGPGFINFYVSGQFLKDVLKQILQLKENFGRSGIGAGRKVLVEYSSPNIAKPLAVHHLLSTIIGQTMADLFKFAGYQTVALNWPGDWGTQFGKLIYAYKTWGNEEDVKKDPLNELLRLYVKFHEEEEKDPALVEKGREEFKKLENGDDENNGIWEWFRDISIKELEKIYKKLGVSFDEYLGERMYLDDAKQIIEEGKEKGIFAEGEKGALIVKFENDKFPPYMVQKADGTTLYATRDLASLKDRIQRLKGNILVYVVDVAQKLHLQQLFETARMFDWGDVELKHLVFGRMQLPEGRMSTRKGDVILLDEVINEAVNRTQKIIAEKSSELPEEEKNHIAEKMAVSAIKYNIISQNPETNITFDWDKMLTLEGNSGPYLQYAYARAKSILRKSAEQIPKPRSHFLNEKQTDLFSLTEEASKEEAPNEDVNKPFGSPAEQKLLHILPQFPEIIESAVKEYKPNIVTTYLFNLARAFNNFYNEVPVLTASSEELRKSRLKLVEAFAQVLQNGLQVLGIEVFERM